MKMQQSIKNEISKLIRNNHYTKLNKSDNIGFVILIVYLVLLSDNMLLTIIVPILPDYIANITNTTKHRDLFNDEHIKVTDSKDDNNYIGLVLATKALSQLIVNPIVGNASHRFGCSLCIFIGTCFLLTSALLLGFAVKLQSLILARLTHGVASAFITVSSMSLVAQVCSENDQRSKLMGITLGSMALGVLLGYPFGSILYDLYGKITPFLAISVIIVINLGIQLFVLTKGTMYSLKISQQMQPKFQKLIQNKMLLALVISIWISTSTVAILESCLPIWLKVHLNSKKWQLGTAFIPDSLGYFCGTNFFGSIAYKYEQIKVSCFSLLLVGISSILIPLASSMYELVLPHFGLGLGIGIIDAALVPLMARFVDEMLNINNNKDEKVNMPTKFEMNGFIQTTTSYGTMYAIQQTPVSMAYLLAPLIGSELESVIGFTWVMWIIGLLNILYAPILAYISYTNTLKGLSCIDTPLRNT